LISNFLSIGIRRQFNLSVQNWF
jgi:hypothetical protein